MGKTAKEIKEIVSFFTAPLKGGDIVVFKKYASMLGDGEIIVDFGTGQGKSAISLGLSNDKAIVYTFEKGIYSDHKIKDEDHIKVIIDRIRITKADNVYFMLGDSLTIYPHWSKTIGLLNIDSEHNDIQVTAELEKWEPFVKNGGHILMHDYRESGRFPGLKKGMDRYFKDESKFEFVEFHGGTQVIKKL